MSTPIDPGGVFAIGWPSQVMALKSGRASSSVPQFAPPSLVLRISHWFGESCPHQPPSQPLWPSKKAMVVLVSGRYDCMTLSLSLLTGSQVAPPSRDLYKSTWLPWAPFPASNSSQPCLASGNCRPRGEYSPSPSGMGWLASQVAPPSRVRQTTLLASVRAGTAQTV